MIFIRLKKSSILLMSAIVFSCCFILGINMWNHADKTYAQIDGKKIINYVKFTPNLEALQDCMEQDISTYNTEHHVNWIDILSYLSIKYGNKYEKYDKKDVTGISEKLKQGQPIEDIVKNAKLLSYYKEAYTAVLGEFLGIRTVKHKDSEEPKEEYGLKVYSPLAKTFPFNHCDDFGASRSFGYSRPHLGHDMMSAVGTPVIAVESGYVEAMGWNKYGGWRIGIRSTDKKRYYYYAHLRQNKPFHINLKLNENVEAGEVIGYVGRTGYSTHENVNNISQSHLHWGLELIFDESQKECNNEIWIDLYSITRLLEKNKSSVRRDPDTKEFFKKS
ncbi:MAG: M23 family metallopeptidase [Candidatus Improbicoccus devescovinae]|nr:MAG: M23 family metallopeptidase [Candidatus Improbicoccus devescovinae]